MSVSSWFMDVKGSLLCSWKLGAGNFFTWRESLFWPKKAFCPRTAGRLVCVYNISTASVGCHGICPDGFLAATNVRQIFRSWSYLQKDIKPSVGTKSMEEIISMLSGKLKILVITSKWTAAKNKVVKLSIFLPFQFLKCRFGHFCTQTTSSRLWGYGLSFLCTLQRKLWPNPRNRLGHQYWRWPMVMQDTPREGNPGASPFVWSFSSSPTHIFHWSPLPSLGTPTGNPVGAVAYLVGQYICLGV